MKKFLGVLVAITLCVCLLAPVSLAAKESDSLADLAALLEENGLSMDAVEDVIDLDSIDIDAFLKELEADGNALAGIEDAVNGANDDTSETQAAAGIDLSFLTDLFAGEMDVTAITDMISGLSEGDFTSLLGTISGAFSGAGVNLASLDLGVDVASLLGSSSSTGGTKDLAASATDLTAGIMDTIKGALETLGLDPAIVENLLDNEIVNFFANMYIGFIGEVEESTTTTKPTTTKPPVVTTKPPKTGDTSSVFVALGTLAVASAAAFVCLKKKED